MTAVTGMGEANDPVGGERRGLRPRGVVICVVLLAAGIGFLWRAFDIRQPGEPLDEGLVLWGVLAIWLLLSLITGNVRSYRQRRLIAQAEASGGTLTEAPSALLWPATVAGIVWRTALVLVPGTALGYYAMAGETSESTSCQQGGTCLVGAGLWLPVAVLLLVGGLVLAVLGARRAVRNARRRADGLPPEVVQPKVSADAPTSKVDRTAVAPVSEPDPPAATPSASARSGDGGALDARLERLAELGRLHEQGPIDEHELERLKAEVLGEQT